MKLVTKYSAATLALIALFAMSPSSALARGSIHLELPGLSIGVHDGHRKHYRKRYRKRHRQHYYYDDYRPRKYYRERKYNRYYDNYYNDHYYNGRVYRQSDRYRNRSVEVCPERGYSRYYIRNRDCYDHNGHYHCG